MSVRICYCCCEKLETPSSDNPNICIRCAQWGRELRPSDLARQVVLVPIENFDPDLTGSLN